MSVSVNYYNDVDPFCCQWLRNLIDAGLIPPGDAFWSAATIVQCTDGNSRRIEPGSFPLAHGIPNKTRPIVARLVQLGVDPKAAKRIVALAKRNRVGRLRGYGNAINDVTAAEFIRAFFEANP